MNDTNEAIESLVILKQVDNDEDYEVKIKRPDGTAVTVLIPKEGIDSYPNRCLIKAHNDNEPFGLNMVTNGHYT